MKVAHVAPTSRHEGSAAWRICRAQQEIGIDAERLVCDSDYRSGTKIISASLISSLTELKLNRLVGAAKAKLLTGGIYDSPWTVLTRGVSGFEKSVLSGNYSVVNLHWVPSLIDLKNLTFLKVPVVLTLHDIWPMTGGCHCNYGCNQWIDGCEACPQRAGIVPRVSSPKKDYQRKVNGFLGSRSLSVVGPSQWICEMARMSPMFHNRTIVQIPNPIDPSRFFPVRRKLQSQTIRLLFVVAGRIDQFGKGFDLVVQIVHELSKRSKPAIELVLVGDDSGVEMHKLSVPIVSRGVVSSEEEMAEIYQQADLLIHASRQDNYPSVVLESLSCGTRVVAFDVGGIRELVSDRTCGIAVDNFDVVQFAESVLELISTPTTYEERLALHKSILERHHPKIVAEKYQALYSRSSQKRSEGSPNYRE